MTRVHPQFLMNGFKKAVEKQDFGEFNKELSTERQLMDGEIFTIRARRCKRCGRLLTSAEAVEKGYGCQCAAKAQAEEDEKKPIPGQMTFDDLFKNMEE